MPRLLRMHSASKARSRSSLRHIAAQKPTQIVRARLVRLPQAFFAI
jgi:hypothetical protein